MRMTRQGITIVGHRGARGEAPENTLPGFQRAVAAGVTEIELDIHLSADSVPVVIHDPTLDRTTYHRGLVNHHDHCSLADMDARRNTPGWPEKTGIPTLHDVVATCPDHLRFQFEVKGASKDDMRTIAQRLAGFIHDENLAERVVVTSSQPHFLGFMRQVAPKQPLGYVCEYSYQRPLKHVQQLNCQWLIAHHRIIKTSLMRQATRQGVRVSVWTVNDLDLATRLVAQGVDSLITDYPTAFMAHFQ